MSDQTKSSNITMHTYYAVIKGCKPGVYEYYPWVDKKRGFEHRSYYRCNSMKEAKRYYNLLMEKLSRGGDSTLQTTTLSEGKEHGNNKDNKEEGKNDEQKEGT